MYAAQKRRIRLIVYLSFNMKIIIAGYGFVGKAIAEAIKTMHEIVIVDPKYTADQIKDHHDADGIIICVGTPETSNNLCDDSQIKAVLKEIPVFLPVLIKSTVLPDQLAELVNDLADYSICYSPEFLRATTANRDFLTQSYMIIGGEDPDCFWQDLFTPVLPNCKLYLNCTISEASTTKYAVNSFLATKVAFFNQIYDVCEANGADYDTVRQLIALDKRIGNSHTVVPGLDHERGFGGACFPKDTKSFSQYSKTLNTPVTILDEAITYNCQVRKNA
jgi:UDPglucose 6-dehydrogenase